MILPPQRKLFDIPDDVAYFNCAYMSPLLHTVVTAGQQGLARKRQPWKILPEEFSSLPKMARERFAKLINADPQGVAIVASASYGLAVAGKNLPLQTGEEILVLHEQFPSNVYVWRELARRQGAHLRVVERPADNHWTPAIREAIRPQTAIVALPHCHWIDGAYIDLESLRADCDRVGAALVLDLTQSAGALPFDCAAIRPDFIACATYKWLLGPYSLGFLYAAPQRREGEPIEYSWATRAGSESFSGLVDYQDGYQPGARRYDMGESTNFALLPAAIAALDQLLSWGVENIYPTLSNLTDDILARVRPLGFNTLARSTRAGHFLGLQLPNASSTNDILQALSKANVYVSARGKTLRITPHLYNTERDIEHLVSALAAAR